MERQIERGKTASESKGRAERWVERERERQKGRNGQIGEKGIRGDSFTACRPSHPPIQSHRQKSWAISTHTPTLEKISHTHIHKNTHT